MARMRMSEKRRRRRAAQAFDRALAAAPPNVRSELVAMAQRQQYTR